MRLLEGGVQQTRSGKAMGVLALALTFSLVTLTPLAALAEEPQHFLEFTEDSYKTALISGNFTASVTKDIPRVVFLHSHTLLSPTFVISTAKIYLLNETGDDSVFNESRVTYTGYLDTHHNEWNVTPLAFVSSTEAGECAVVKMSKLVSLYERLNDSGNPKVIDWANVTFQFMISERMANYTNAYGGYSVPGKISMRVNFTIQVLKPVPSKFMVIEQELKGGGKTNTFLLKESNAPPPDMLTQVEARVEDSLRLGNYTHKFNQMSGPMQDIYFAKEDRTIQAMFRFGSAPTNGTGPGARVIPMNSSFYTTGTSMILLQMYTLGDSTTFVAQDMSLGINEAGFIVKVKDWFERNLPMLMVVLGSLSLVITIPLLITIYRKHFWRKKPVEEETADKKL